VDYNQKGAVYIENLIIDVIQVNPIIGTEALRYYGTLSSPWDVPKYQLILSTYIHIG